MPRNAMHLVEEQGKAAVAMLIQTAQGRPVHAVAFLLTCWTIGFELGLLVGSKDPEVARQVIADMQNTVGLTEEEIRSGLEDAALFVEKARRIRRQPN
jgi:hypothetical protein